MSNQSKYVRYNGDDDWSALYVDGKLSIVGDHYYVDQKIAELLGVEERIGNDFLLGGSRYEDVAQTLQEIEGYQEPASTLSEMYEQAGETVRAMALAFWIKDNQALGISSSESTKSWNRMVKTDNWTETAINAFNLATSTSLTDLLAESSTP